MKLQVLIGILIVSPLMANDEVAGGAQIECGTRGIEQPIEPGDYFSEFGLTEDQAKENSLSEQKTNETYWEILQMTNTNYCALCHIFGNCTPFLDVINFDEFAGIIEYDAYTETWSSGIRLYGDSLAVYLECSSCFD